MKFFLLVIFYFIFNVSYTQTAESLYNEGLELKKNKKSKEAAEKFTQALKLNSNYIDARYELGWCQNDIKAYSRAIENLRIVRQKWNTIPKVFFELGYAFSKTKMTDSAIAALTKCIELKQDYANAHKELAFIYYDKDDIKKALEYFNTCASSAKTEITDYLFWYRKGYIENANKDYTAAKASLLSSLKFKTDYVNTYLELGFSNSKLKENDSSIYYFQKAIKIDPNGHIGYNGIGEVYRDNIKDYDKALEWYRKVLAMNPKERKANFGVGYSLNTQKKYTEAIPYLQQAIESEKTYTAAYVELGYSQYKTGAYAIALQNLNKAMELDSKNHNARYYAVLVYIVQNNKAMAQKMVDELKTLNSKYINELQEKVNKM